MKQEQEIKYTRDGRKVWVIEKLNKEQFIVQEVFVDVSGEEFVGGEKFVAENLQDKTKESWKDKTLRELEERFERDRNTLEKRVEEQQKRLNNAIHMAKIKADALLSFSKNANESQLETLKAFMAGEITHFYERGFGVRGIMSFGYSECIYRGTFEAMKLVTLFGKSDGSLSYKIHQYSDGSGGSVEITPCKSYEEALALAQADFDVKASDYMSREGASINITCWQRIEGLHIPEEVRKKLEDEKKASNKKKIEELKNQIKKLKMEVQ